MLGRSRHDRLGVCHLGVEPAVPREEAQEVARVAVRVADHWGDAEALGANERARGDRGVEPELHACHDASTALWEK